MPTPAPSRRRIRWTFVALAIAAIVFLWDLRHSAQALVSRVRASPLTTFPGSETYPAFSPDGQQVAFSWLSQKPGDTRHICVKPAGREDLIQLTRGDGDDIAPAWSPDGRQIAFTRLEEEQSGYYVVDAAGRGPAPRKIAGFPDIDESEPPPTLSWTSDGKAVAIAEKGSVYLISTDTGEKKKVAAGDRNPVVSPDGRRVAFLRQTESSKGDIYVASLAGGDVRRITWLNDKFDGLAWMPDSRAIVYSARWEGFDFWKISASGGTPQPLRDYGHGQYPALSRAGTLAFSRTARNTKVFRFEVPQKGPFPAPVQVAVSTRLDDWPQVSPDGRRIAFTSDRAGSSQLWVCDVTGANPVQLTNFKGGRRLVYSRWSPDSRRISFEYNETGRPQVYVIDADGGVPKQITTDAGWRASWSRDGKWVYFSFGEHIWKVPSGGGRPERVIRTWGTSAMESPDGQYIYYIRGRSLWRVTPAGKGEDSPVSEAIQVADWDSWSVARNGIFYVERDRPSRKLLVQFYSFGTRNITKVAELDMSRWGSSVSFSASGDGKTIYYYRSDESETDLMGANIR